MDDTKQSESYEPAFPCFERIPDDESGIEHYGMSLREYFAAKAMQGLLASPRAPGDGDENPVTTESIARLSYLMANAMLAERGKT